MTAVSPDAASTESHRDVFISYRSSDDHLVRPVVEGLTDAGISCWFAPNDLQVFDDRLTQKIRAGIRTSRATLAFISDTYQTSNACKWEVIESVSHGDLGSLLHVKMPGAEQRWTAVQENVFAQLPTTDGDIAAVATKLKDRLANLPLRNGAPPVGDAWWETRWAGPSATGMFAERLALLGLLTEHIGRDGADTGPPEVAQVVGFGGTGKSMLALQFARDFERLFVGGIVRINAGADARGGDLDDRVDAMQDILRQVIAWIEHWTSQHGPLRAAVPKPQDADAWVQARSCVIEILARSEHRGLLWIVDDLPDGLTADEVQRIICPSPGHTLITTRTERYTALVGDATLQLHGMALEDAVLLLVDGNADLLASSTAVLKDIANEVGCHALTLAVLARMIASNKAPRTLKRVRQPHPQAAKWLERAAVSGMELPTGHESTILGTLSSSILSADGIGARTLLRLASIWPKGQRMAGDMLEQMLGDEADHGRAELTYRRLATTETDDSVTVHAMISTVTGWLIADGTLEPRGDEPSERELRLAAATVAGAALPEVKPTDVWLESDAGQVVWHLLEPISSILDDKHLALAARALLAMARLPMRHKPAGLQPEELVEVLTTAGGWAQEAQRLYGAMRGTSTEVDKAVAMSGLLRRDLAEVLSGQEAIDECESGTQQLREVVAIRQDAARVEGTATSREFLAKVYFNLGRLIKVAKKLEEHGAQPGVPDALDDALDAYVAAARIRKELLSEAGGEGRAKRTDLEDLASSYRGMAIVRLTRVCRQDGLSLALRRELLAEALVPLAEARGLTCTGWAKDASTQAAPASPEMGKDLGVLAHVQLCRWLLATDEVDLARRWREAEPCVADAVKLSAAREIAADSVPWPAKGSDEPSEPLTSARLALARLTVNHDRGGKHPSGAATLAEFRKDDLPALIRRLSSGIMNP